MLIIIAAGLSLIGGLLTLIIKSLSHRVRHLEETTMPKQEVRQLVDDKIGGIHLDIQELKAKVEKLYDLLIAGTK